MNIDHWGMYTSKGNKSLQAKADKLKEKLKASNGDYRKMDRAVCNFFRSYARMCHSKSYQEASDTAVRDAVWGVAQSISRGFGYDENSLNRAWEHREEG